MIFTPTLLGDTDNYCYDLMVGPFNMTANPMCYGRFISSESAENGLIMAGLNTSGTYNAFRVDCGIASSGTFSLYMV